MPEAIAFYRFRLGDKNEINKLAEYFDNHVGEGDPWIVGIFGYLKEWDITTPRMAAFAKVSDASGTELLCSALMWKRYLHKDVVIAGKLQHLYDVCRPE